MAARRVTGKRKRGSQLGFTMVELLVAIAISGVIVVGSLMLLSRIITVSDENRNKTTASQEVQYVGFWISEDIIQAQTITLGDPVTGFPLTVWWLDTGNDAEHTVIYSLEGPQDGLYKIEREKWIYQPGPGNVSQGKTLVGKYLVGQDINDVDKDGNKTEWLTKANRYIALQEDPLVGKVSSLKLNVTANVHNRVATNEYEIHPRAFSRWSP
jgi:prepilin-type N-terminal cleavage/methylation domain-containing protein